MEPITPWHLQRLLVPLDGSRLAESALPAAQALAERFHGSVTLIHILEQRAPATVHGERHLMGAAEAASYLDGLCERFRQAGVSVAAHVHEAREGDVARSVVEHSEEFTPDLVVLCPHGRGGLRDLLFGSIAQQVLQKGSRPVLLVRPEHGGADPPPFQPELILVPLDGEHSPDAALGAATGLALAFDAELHLTMVVPTPGTLSGDSSATRVLLPATTRAILELSRQERADYLKQAVERCKATGVRVWAQVQRGDTVAEVLETSERLKAGMLVMASHGRAGLDALLSGSVAPRITTRAGCPLLLVRA
ncbi:MAG TPA: universal stress protein [Armatimonadota bacterium]|jgi:nucleotide-binding universal stress UspA family protein